MAADRREERLQQVAPEGSVNGMAKNDGFRKYVEAGAVLSQVTRARAEEIVRELVGAGEVPRHQAQEWIDDLVERSKKASEGLVNLVRQEVAAQLSARSFDPEQLAKQVADILRQSAEVGKSATRAAAGTATSSAGKTAAAARGATRAALRTGAQSTKAAARKVAARSGAAGQAEAKKAATKKAATKKAATQESAPKKAAAKKAAAKKAAPKKAAPKKAAPKKTASRTAGPGAGSTR
jgi:polyhydroxyalkanoate synthesis regulator phasin